MDTALYTSTFQSDCQRHSCSFFDLLCLLLRSSVWFDQDCADTRDQLLRKVQTALEKVGDDNWFGTCCASRQKCNKTDWASTTIEGCNMINRGLFRTRMHGTTNQITRGSPRRRPDLSMPAKATASGSQREPSSKDTLSGNLWIHCAGWRCHLVKVPERGYIKC
jgi:hypothetical protein